MTLKTKTARKRTSPIPKAYFEEMERIRHKFATGHHEYCFAMSSDREGKPDIEIHVADGNTAETVYMFSLREAIMGGGWPGEEDDVRRMIAACEDIISELKEFLED